jgi:hypothetical protein
MFGPRTNEIGIVTAIRNGGFYVRHTTGMPTAPGGRIAAYASTFFRLDQIGERGFHGEGVTLRGKNGGAK